VQAVKAVVADYLPTRVLLIVERRGGDGMRVIERVADHGLHGLDGLMWFGAVAGRGLATSGLRRYLTR
jgi:hypothetical protein